MIYFPLAWRIRAPARVTNTRLPSPSSPLSQLFIPSCAFFAPFFAFSQRVSARHDPLPLPAIDPTNIPAIYNEGERGGSRRIPRRIPRNIQAGSTDSFTDLDGFGDKQAAIRIGVASFQVTKRRYCRFVVRWIGIYMYMYICIYIYISKGGREAERFVSCDNGGTLMFRVPISFLLLLLFLLSFTVSRRYRVGYIHPTPPTALRPRINKECLRLWNENRYVTGKICLGKSDCDGSSCVLETIETSKIYFVAIENNLSLTYKCVTLISLYFFF